MRSEEEPGGPSRIQEHLGSPGGPKGTPWGIRRTKREQEGHPGPPGAPRGSRLPKLPGKPGGPRERQEETCSGGERLRHPHTKPHDWPEGGAPGFSVKGPQGPGPLDSL